MVSETKIWVLGMLIATGVQSQGTELGIMHMYTSLHVHMTIFISIYRHRQTYIWIDIYMNIYTHTYKAKHELMPMPLTQVHSHSLFSVSPVAYR